MSTTSPAPIARAITTPSSAAALAVPASAGVVAVGTVLVGPLVAFAATVVVGGVAAAVDLRTRRLPNRIVAIGALVALAGVAGATASGTTGAVLAAGAGALGFAGPLFVAHLLSPLAIGFGDVKLAAVLGLAIGLVEPRLGLVALCVASGVTALAGLATRRNALPLGPGLVTGALTAVTIGPTVWP